jgi:hypothetical protein
MNTVVRKMTAAQDAPANPAPRRNVGLGLMLVADALLSFAPVVILGAAIGWPASLDKPAAEQLGAIASQPAVVAWGYAVYLLYSMLVAPVMIGLASRTFGGLNGAVAATVAAFAALSALARSIGILRWLTVMPMLAAAHAGAGADPVLRHQIEWLFKGLTDYGGGVGEVLGVSVLMAASLGTLSVAALARGGMPRWIASLGVVSALLLAALSLPVVGGPEIVPIAAAVSVLSVWMLAAGVWAMTESRVS